MQQIAHDAPFNTSSICAVELCAAVGNVLRVGMARTATWVNPPAAIYRPNRDGRDAVLRSADGDAPLELPATLTPDEVRRLLWLEQLDSVCKMIAAGELAAREVLVGIIRVDQAAGE
jgi:hypothetical protein